MIYWINSYWRFLISVLKYVWHIVFNVNNYREEWTSFVKRDILQYDYVRNALISITTSYLITILVKLDTLVSIELTATLLLSWFLLLLSTLLFLKIFFVFRNFEEGWKTTNKSGDFEELKLHYSLSKIMSSEESKKFEEDNNNDIVELISKRWINLIRLILLFVFASIALLVFSSLEGFQLKKSSNTSKIEIENMATIENKIDSLTFIINANQLDNHTEFDSLRSVIRVLQNKIPIVPVKIINEKITK